MFRQELVCLATHRPVAGGKKRLVYRHPGRPDLLIKVFRTPQPGLNLKYLRLVYDRFVFVSSLIREIREFLISQLEQHDPFVKHLPDILSLIQTDLGTGLVVAAAESKNGALAKPLAQLMTEGGLTPERVALLDQFLTRMQNSNLVVGDLTSGNIVLADIAGPGERFILVDGLGDKTFVPLQRYSQVINRYSKRRRIARLRAKVSEHQAMESPESTRAQTKRTVQA